MGDGIDPVTGALQFPHTDIDLSGNSDLTVRLSRKRSLGWRHDYLLDEEFGDWELDVPKISALTTEDRLWRNGGNRCSSDYLESFPPWETVVLPPLFDPNGGRAQHIRIDPDTYSNGIHVSVPVKALTEMFHSRKRGGKYTDPGQPNDPYPENAGFVTTDGWYFTCTNAGIRVATNLDYEPASLDEGFIGHSPDGLKYYFNFVYVKRAVDQRWSVRSSVAPQKFIVSIVATRVEDSHGNTVSYEYDRLGRLLRIVATDGRHIDISYNGDSKLISSATANNRTWQYKYRRSRYVFQEGLLLAGSISSSQVLDAVLQPDGLSWSFNLDGMSATPAPAPTCGRHQQVVTLLHPNGSRGQFTLTQRDIRVSLNKLLREYKWCPDPDPTSPNSKPRYSNSTPRDCSPSDVWCCSQTT